MAFTSQSKKSVKVTVKHIIQPVSFICLNEANCEIVESNIQLCFHDINSLTVANPQCGKKYCIFDDKKWCRVTLNEVTNNSVKGWLLEKGKLFECAKDKLREMPEILNSLPASYSRYRLKGLRPLKMNIVEDLNNPNKFFKPKMVDSEAWTEGAYKEILEVLSNSRYIIMESLKMVKEFCYNCDSMKFFKNGETVSLADFLIEKQLARLKDNPQDESSTECSDGHSIAEYFSDIASDQEQGLAKQKVNLRCKLLSPVKNTSPRQKVDHSRPMNSTGLEKSRGVTKGIETITKLDLDNNVLLRGSRIPPPLLTFKDARLSPIISTTLTRIGTESLLFVQTYLVPSIVRCRDVLAIAKSSKGKTTGCIMALISKFSDIEYWKSLPNSRGPLAIIIEPTWTKAQKCADFLTQFFSISSGNVSSEETRLRVLCTYGADISKYDISILTGCEVLVSTAPCLLRILQKEHLLDLKRLSCIIFDDMDVLVARHLQIVRNIFQCRQRALCTQSLAGEQIVCVSSRWTPGIRSFLTCHMKQPIEIINDKKEAALRVNLAHYFHILPEDCLTWKLKVKELKILLENVKVGQRRVMIACGDAPENPQGSYQDIYDYLMDSSSYNLFCAPPNLSEEAYDNIFSQWNASSTINSLPVMICCDSVLMETSLPIRNVEVLIHWDYFSSQKRDPLPSRLFTMKNLFSSFTDPKEGTVRTNPGLHDPVSFFILRPCDIEARFCRTLVLYLKRVKEDREETVIPGWLIARARQHRLEQKLRERRHRLCEELKKTGRCKAPACPYRHIMDYELDSALLPNSGTIEFKLVCNRDSFTPSKFFVNLEKHYSLDGVETDYRSDLKNLHLKMAKFYSDGKNVIALAANEIEPGVMACIQVAEGKFRRVKVIRKERCEDRSERVLVRMVDEGNEEVFPLNCFIRLSESLSNLRPIAIEAIVANIKPVDDDEEYDMIANQQAFDILKEKKLNGRIVLCLSSTLWIDSVSHSVLLPTSGVKLRDIYKHILINKKLVLENNDHIDRLHKLCAGQIDVPNSDPAATPYAAKHFTYENSPVEDSKLTNISVTQCLITHFINPTHLFFARNDEWDNLWNMMDDISYHSRAILPCQPHHISVDSLVLVKRSGHQQEEEEEEEEDKNWYRARIISVTENQCRVALIDFGDVFDCSIDKLKRLPSEYRILSAQAIECSIINCLPRNEEWENSATQALEEYFFQEENPYVMEVRKINKDKKTQCKLVEITRQFDSSELAHYLIQREVARPNPYLTVRLFPPSQHRISPLLRRASVPHMAYDLFLNQGEAAERVQMAKTIEKIAPNQSAKPEKQEIVLECLETMIAYLTNIWEILPLCRAFVKICDNPDFNQSSDEDTVVILSDKFFQHVFHLLETWSSVDDPDQCLHVLPVLIDVIYVVSYEVKVRQFVITSVPNWTKSFVPLYQKISANTEFVMKLFETCSNFAFLFDCLSMQHYEDLINLCCICLRSETNSSWLPAVSLLWLILQPQRRKTFEAYLRSQNIAPVVWEILMSTKSDKDATELAKGCCDLLIRMWQSGFVDRPGFVSNHSPQDLKPLLASVDDQNINAWHVELIKELSRVSNTPHNKTQSDKSPSTKKEKIFKGISTTSNLKPLQDQSSYPDVQWFERKRTLLLIIRVENCVSLELCPVTICGNTIQLRYNKSDNEPIAFDLELHDSIVSEKCEVKCSQYDVRVLLTKSQPKIWNFPYAKGAHVPFLRKCIECAMYDVEADDENDGESEDEEDALANSKARFRPIPRLSANNQRHDSSSDEESGVVLPGDIVLRDDGAPDSDIEEWLDKGCPKEKPRPRKNSDSSSEEASGDSDVNLEGQTRKTNPADDDQLDNFYSL